MARLAGYGGAVYIGSKVLEDCEDAWNEFVDADVTLSLDTTDYRVGSGSNKMVQAAGLAVGDILASEVVAVGDLSAYSIAFAWLKSSVNTTAVGDYLILLDNDALCATPELQLNVPILTADTWKFCQLTVAAGTFAAVTAGISIGLKLAANDPGAATIWIDFIQAAAEVVGIRAWSLDAVANVQDSTGFSDGQAKVFTVTQTEWSGTFEGFKDGVPLAIGTVVALELRESATATQQWRGSAIITSCRPSSSVDGLQMYSYDFQGIRELEWPTT